MYKKLNAKGFTLIELLIVIIIIGILAAIAFVAYNGVTNKAHEADAQTTLDQVRSKLGVYYANNNNYPAPGTASGTSACGSTAEVTINVDNWLDSTDGGNNKSLCQTFVDSSSSGTIITNGYSYSLTPSGCTGDTIDTTGTITPGTGTPCTGFTLTAGPAVAPTGTINVTN